MARGIEDIDRVIKKLLRLSEFADHAESILGDVGTGIVNSAMDNISRNDSLLTGEMYMQVDDVVQIRGTRGLLRVFTPQHYAKYVEFGTGPKGQRNHRGTSPNIQITYRKTPWFARTSDFVYYWVYGFPPFNWKGEEWIRTYGQKAAPFLYPAMNDNRKLIMAQIAKSVRKVVKNAGNA